MISARCLQAQVQHKIFINVLLVQQEAQQEQQERAVIIAMETIIITQDSIQILAVIIQKHGRDTTMNKKMPKIYDLNIITMQVVRLLLRLRRYLTIFLGD